MHPGSSNRTSLHSPLSHERNLMVCVLPTLTLQEFPPFQPTADGSTECGFPQGDGAAGKQPPLTTGFAELPKDATEGTTDTATDEELLPYMARVFGPAANCSGVLIAPGYLLTSGWCMWRVSEGLIGLVYLAPRVGCVQWLGRDAVGRIYGSPGMAVR